MITAVELQELRSPRSLREFVLRVKDAVQKDRAEFEEGELKKGFYKEFLDELVPLSCYAVLAYPDDCLVQLQLGNQAYDAIVYDAAGHEVDRVELTVPQDGAAKAKDRELVVKLGFGRVAIGTPGDDFVALFPLVLSTCKAKAQKDYSGCTLVVAVEPIPSFEGLADAHDALISELAEEMRKIHFRARRVHLLVLPDRLVEIHG